MSEEVGFELEFHMPVTEEQQLIQALFGQPRRYGSLLPESEYPLHYYIIRKQYQEFKSWLNEQQSDVVSNTLNTPLTKTKSRYFPLHLATIVGQYEMVRDILETGYVSPDQIGIKNVPPVYGETIEKAAIHIAATHGYTEIVQLLIQHGANVNLVKKGGGYEYDGQIIERRTTALLSAVSHQHASIVKLLIENRADVNVMYTYRMTVENRSEYKYRNQSALGLCSTYDISSNDNDPLTINNKAITKMLVDAGANDIVNNKSGSDRYEGEYSHNESIRNLYLIWYFHLGQHWPLVRTIWLSHLKNPDTFFSKLPSDVIGSILEFTLASPSALWKKYNNQIGYSGWLKFIFRLDDDSFLHLK
jgi:ankyrin repeat protein